ncbi:MAG: anti-sigma regulatory factor [Candidatus Latescibacterota bacterium]
MGPSAGEVAIATELDIVAVRRCVRHVAVGLGFGATDTTRILTAASELARNVYQYAGGGVMGWRALADGGRAGIELVFTDHGPGIPDVAEALTPGYSTSRGLGLGLPGARRLMGEMEIASRPSQGTTVTVRKWLGGP